MDKIKLEKFEGPLELLLSLIEDKKLEITDIALAEVTEHYMKALQKNEDWLGPAELADFLMIASRLLLIKSRVLLPLFDWGDDEKESLSEQLRMYKLYADATKVIDRIAKKQTQSFSRPRVPRMTEVIFSPPKYLEVIDLARIMHNVIEDLKPFRKIPEKVYRRVINLQEIIQNIYDLIKKRKSVSFMALLDDAQDRTEIVVNFIAVLELIKRQQIHVKQQQNFSEIKIMLT